MRKEEGFVYCLCPAALMRVCRMILTMTSAAKLMMFHQNEEMETSSENTTYNKLLIDKIQYISIY